MHTNIIIFTLLQRSPILSGHSDALTPDVSYLHESMHCYTAIYNWVHLIPQAIGMCQTLEPLRRGWCQLCQFVKLTWSCLCGLVLSATTI